jgi:hypothetical protein
MIILFYSKQCNLSNKLVEYITKNKLIKYFNMINVDVTNKIPDNITIVPTIIDTTIEAPIEGKLAFEYVMNQKYFNNPTNNIDYWLVNPLPKPNIDEDKKAIEKHNFNFASVDDCPSFDEPKSDPNQRPKMIINKKQLAIMKVRR